MPPANAPARTNQRVQIEAALQRVTAVYVVTGLLFMLLPGTFLGVWNLISISGRQSLAALSPAWLQAHGHAQIFGWIGTFVIGIGYYSLCKMNHLPAAAVGRAWLTWGFWTAGLILRWVANVNLWSWRELLPLSAVFELAAFLIFFATVRGDKGTASSGAAKEKAGLPAWMKLVVASTSGFLLLLLVNLGAAAYLAINADGPAIPHWFDQRYLVLATWGFPVLAVWGFNARWLPVFLGLKQPSDRTLIGALWTCAVAVLSAMFGYFVTTSVLAIAASAASIAALRLLAPAQQPAKLDGVHASVPFFARLCYGWLMIAAILSLWAAIGDTNGGIWGASRHALTVGFLAAMIFTIGQRVLPAFCGMRRLFSSKLMLAACVALNLGCTLRVASEIPAYEGFAQFAWHILPVSAILELTAVSLFAANILVTLIRPPAHIQRLHNIAAA